VALDDALTAVGIDPGLPAAERTQALLRGLAAGT